jgi:hypothetical protein
MDRLPQELIEEISYALPTVCDYTQLAVANKRLHRILAKKQSLKRFVLQRFEHDFGISVFFLFRQLQQKNMVDILEAMLAMPELLQIDAMDVDTFVLTMHTHFQSTSDMKRLEIELKMRVLTAFNAVNGDTAEGRRALQSIFRHAVQDNNQEMIEFLIKDCKLPADNISNALSGGWYVTLLCDRRSDLFLTLLNAGASIDGAHMVVIQMLSSYGSVEALDFVLERIQRENTQPEFDLALLNTWNAAAFEGNAAIIRLCLSKYHVDPNFADGIALRWACRRGYVEILDALAEFGHDLIAAVPMFSAIRYHQTAIVKRLIHHGADIDVQDCAMLREAVRLGFLDVVEALLEAGAKVNERVMDVAREHNDNDIIALLSVVE